MLVPKRNYLFADSSVGVVAKIVTKRCKILVKIPCKKFTCNKINGKHTLLCCQAQMAYSGMHVE